jgi:hypothetical protein
MVDRPRERKASNIVINIWNNLTLREREEVKNKAMIYFPELFSNRSDKFGRLAIWLVTREGVVCPNVRDSFTAGGKGEFIVGTKLIRKVPRILINLFNNLDFILETLAQTSSIELSEYWEMKTNEKKKLSDWIDLVSENSKKIPDAKHLNIKEILTELIYK